MGQVHARETKLMCNMSFDVPKARESRGWAVGRWARYLGSLLEKEPFHGSRVQTTRQRFVRVVTDRSGPEREAQSIEKGVHDVHCPCCSGESWPAG